ncbi:hypothetical protein ACJJTC_010568 [Scirpophaga incertulas]
MSSPMQFASKLLANFRRSSPRHARALSAFICRHRGYCYTRQRQSASTETPEEATESVAGPSAGLPPNSNNQSTEKCSENVSVNVRGYKDRGTTPVFRKLAFGENL